MDPFDLLVENLRGTIPISTAYRTKEHAYEELKRISGEDWGYDADAWYARKKDILKTCPPPLTDISKIRSREKDLRRRMRERPNDP